jgi:uncharacterized protein (TIGR03790 family)
LIRIIFALLLFACFTTSSATALGPQQLGVVINLDDPLSVAIGEYYRQVRRIPEANVVGIRFDAKSETLYEGDFLRIKKEVDERLPATVQVLALTWLKPFRVECMSITSAFAFGFDRSFCAEGCTTTRFSPYFNASTRAPYTDLHMRPAMSIAANSLDEARALIDRGVRADASMPKGTAYLMKTGDLRRDVRVRGYSDAQMLVAGRIHIEQQTGYLQGRTDVMFYFTGAERVPDIAANRYLPGAVADHLTSFGGMLTGSSQMSSLEWLRAGATGSYGAVIEPCAFTSKFPNPGLMMKHYLDGETLIESYWKSVAMPGQGIFIGEPLAAPYAPRGSP